MFPNFWCSLEVAAAEPNLCFVIKGNMYWKRTFLPMVTIVVTSQTYEAVLAIYTTCYCVIRQKRFQSVDSQNERTQNETAVFSYHDAETCNVIRSYEKCKTSEKKRKNLAVLATTPRLNRFF